MPKTEALVDGCGHVAGETKAQTWLLVMAAYAWTGKRVRMRSSKLFPVLSRNFCKRYRHIVGLKCDIIFTKSCQLLCKPNLISDRDSSPGAVSGQLSLWDISTVSKMPSQLPPALHCAPAPKITTL